MPHKTPVRHHVNSHRRSKSNVTDYNRGRGHAVGSANINPGRSIQVLQSKQRQNTVDAHRRNLKKIGDNISYLHSGKRVSGVVVGIRAEYYLVERNGEVWKVDRHSVFTVIGGALKGAGAKMLVSGKAGLDAAVKTTKAGIAKAKEKAPGVARGVLAKAKLGGRAVAVSAKASIERRAEERHNWKEWKKEMEREEKKVLERAKLKIRLAEKKRKYREKVRKGPLWKRSAKFIGKETLEETSVATAMRKKGWMKPKKKIK